MTVLKTEVSYLNLPPCHGILLNVLQLLEQNVLIDSSIFTYFGAICVKRIRRFDLLTTDLGHALVVYDLTQIPAEGSGCRWGAAGIPDHDPLCQFTGSSHRQPMRDQDL